MTINVKELKHVSINELIEIIKNNKLLFELPEKNYILELNILSYGYFMYIEPIHDEKFFIDLKMVNDINEVKNYFYERFNDIIVHYGTVPITKTIKDSAIIIKHIIDIYHKIFISTKKELLLQII